MSETLRDDATARAPVAVSTMDRWPSAALSIALVLTVACAPKPVEWEPATTPGPTRVEIFRGILHQAQSGRLTLVPCGRHLHLDVEDRTGGALQAARSELAPSAGDELFVEMRVERGIRSDDWRTPQDWVLVATELLRAMPVGEGDWCSTALKPGQLRASGNEPFWSVTVSPEGIEWREPDLPAPVWFPAATPGVEGAGLTWISTLEGSPRRQIRVVVTPGICRDGMSAAWYPKTAEVMLDDRVFHGCAYGSD